jgi:hypothetical protein
MGMGQEDKTERDRERKETHLITRRWNISIIINSISY